MRGSLPGVPSVPDHPGSCSPLRLSPPGSLQSSRFLLLGAPPPAGVAGGANSASSWVPGGGQIKAAPRSCLLAAVRGHRQGLCPLPRLLHGDGKVALVGEEGHGGVLVAALVPVGIPEVPMGAGTWGATVTLSSSRL